MIYPSDIKETELEDTVDVIPEFNAANISWTEIWGVVKDQLTCEACWAFGTVRTIEARNPMSQRKKM
jgi:C1A family cysteine protease